MSDPVSQSSADHADIIRAEAYRRMYELSAIGIFRATPDGRYVMANPAGVRMHGYDSEAELLRAVRNIAGEVYVDSRDRETIRRLLEEQGSIEGFECEIYRHKTRERFWVRQNIHRVTDEDGRLWYLQGYVEDITDRKRVEEELREAREELERRVAERTKQLQATNQALETEITERRRAEEEVNTRDAWLRAILENAPIEIALKDTEGRIMAISRNVAEEQNVPAASFAGTTTADYLPPEIAENYMAADRQVVRTGEALQREVREEVDGKVRYSLSQKFPMRDEQGAIKGICSLTTDITEMKEAEARLAQAQKMEAVGQLTGGVAHDFNNLLAVIMGNAELLTDRLGSDDRQLQTILRATTRGAELTQRLLAFSRQQTLKPRSIDMAALVNGLSDLLTRTLGETIEIATVVDPDSWAAWADQGQVENALLNLAINARDAMPEGGKLTIECQNAHPGEAYVARNPEVVAGDYVVLAVSDNGTGMSAEVQAQVFEPFFTTKDVGKGSGLGLSMVYGFAKQSDGYVTIYSELDQGTTVKIYLPRSEEEAQGEAESQSGDIPQGLGETILIIEDDADVRALAVQMLEGLGYLTISVPDVSSANATLADGMMPDLVLSDVVLPGGISGPEFAEMAHETYPDLKVIFMSGYPAEAVKRNQFLGSDKVLLNKPFQMAQLAKALREALD